MIRYRDLVRVNVMPYWNLVVENARKASIGGKSQIHDAASRLDRLRQDQLVGQAGELALSLYLFGNPLAYTRNRAERNTNPHRGDNGSDIPGGNVDVKSSNLKEGIPWNKYTLFVRDRELHRHTVYILALVEGIPSVLDPVLVEVRLIGWISYADFMAQSTLTQWGDSVVRGVRAPLLNPLMPLKWATSGQQNTPSRITEKAMCV